MPEQIPISETRMSSEPSSCLKMGALALDTDDIGTDIYRKLGLKEHEDALKTPRFLSLLSSLIANSIQKNEYMLEIAEIKDVPTVFHGSRSPSITIEQYIERIFKYAGCSPSCFIVAYIYVDRYIQQTKAHLTSLNVHRLLATSVMVAAKFIDDSFYNNAYFAKVGGISTSEMNKLEMKLLFSIDFRLQVNIETFRRYCVLLENEAGGCQLDWTVKACWVKGSLLRKEEYPSLKTPVAR